jgi:hypothetical protein
VLERKTPYLLFTTLIPSIFVSVLTSGRQEEWEEVRVKHHLQCMLKNFKREFNGDYRSN